MKLKTLLLLVSLIAYQAYAQVSVSSKHIGPSANFENGVLEKFKKSTTVFVLSNIYEKEVYENILKASWTVTPYKVVMLPDFKIEDYWGNDYSIVRLSGFKRIKQMKYGGESVSLFTYMDFAMYDSNTIVKELKELSPKKKERKLEKIIKSNTTNVARFYLYAGFPFTAMQGRKMDEAMHLMYNEKVIYNYSPGFLKNYFQKINQLLIDEEVYWMYQDIYLAELQNLSNSTLYIPSYLTTDYNNLTDEKLQKVFKDYDYNYEVIADEELSSKIMNNEEVHYLRYARMNAEQFIQVVNSRTGEIVYSNYIEGTIQYSIKAKHIEAISNAIKKSSKQKTDS